MEVTPPERRLVTLLATKFQFLIDRQPRLSRIGESWPYVHLALTTAEYTVLFHSDRDLELCIRLCPPWTQLEGSSSPNCFAIEFIRRLIDTHAKPLDGLAEDNIDEYVTFLHDWTHEIGCAFRHDEWENTLDRIKPILEEEERKIFGG